MVKSDNFVLFYGGPFSQWYQSAFMVDGIVYVTAEQYMMAMKAEYFGDEKAKNQIMLTTSPSEQKAIGRMVKNFNAEAWDAVSRDYVYKGNLAKFGQNLSLKIELMATGNKEFVEASPYDKVWGVGLGEDDPKILDKANWLGKNWLGETLMKVREDLREQY